MKRKLESITCGICLEDKEERELTILDKCSHMFCEGCIVKWEEKKNTCPTCRTEFNYLSVPYRTSRKRVRCLSKERNLLHSAIVLYIMSATYRADVAKGCLNGEINSQVVFQYIRRIIPNMETESLEFEINIMLAIDAIDRLHTIYSSASLTR